MGALFLIIGGVILLFGIIVSPSVRCVVFNPHKVIPNGIKDLYKYFKYKKWNECDYGYIHCYIAQDSKAFGCGKTLSSVEYIDTLYKQYNDKLIWDRTLNKFVTQKITVLSNVAFKQIPYIRLESMAQYISYLEERYKKDKEEGVKTITVLFVDEAGSAFNSRSFASNFNPLAIKTILCARHYASFLILSSQRFSMCDALLRQVTNVCISCDKLWRLQRLNYYDAYEMENAQNPTLVEPYAKKCWFVTDNSYAKYDTFAQLEDIKKKCEEGDMLTEAEILANQCNVGANVEGVMKPSKKYTKSRKKMTK